MSYMFGQGEGQSERRGRGPGISILDLEELPSALRKIMRLLLRKTEMTYGELFEAVEALPAAERLSQPELDEALDELSQQQWLLRISDSSGITYKVNLRRRARSRLRADIWDALERRSSILH